MSQVIEFVNRSGKNEITIYISWESREIIQDIHDRWYNHKMSPPYLLENECEFQMGPPKLTIPLKNTLYEWKISKEDVWVLP